MQVATLFRESATLLGAQMMESPSSCSSSSSAASSIVSTHGTISQASELSSTSTTNIGPLLEDSQTDNQHLLSQQQQNLHLDIVNQNQNLNMNNNLHEEKKNMHEQLNNQPSPLHLDHNVHHQIMHHQNHTMQNHMHHNHHLHQNMNQREQHQHQSHPLQHNYRSVLDFIGETKKTDMYHQSHQNIPPPHFVDHHKIRHFEEDEEKNYEHLPNQNMRNQEPSQDDGYETGGALSDMSMNQQISMNAMLPNNYHYMMSSRNMQRPPPSLPKMEYCNESRHGQTTPLTPSGISDDPYRFVDDELSSPTQTIVSGVDNSVPTPNQMMPNYAISSEGSILTHHQGSQHNDMRNFMPNDAVIANNNALIKEPKKRGRKKKLKDDNCSLVEVGIEISRPIKERKKHDRFNGMSEEEVSQRFLPDHISENLDIVIIGINPGLFAAYKGHHYAGPGNHFWKCLYLSGLTNEQMTADEDYKLLHGGIGFTNMVQRPTKGSADLTRKEIKEGCLILLEKLRKYQPKIAVFNGKLIFEVFSGKKDFAFGKQAELIEGTQTHMWVMPSSSARCAQLPRAADKVPFYASLKKFRDYLNGHIKDLDESEFVFNDPKLKAICDVSLDQLKIDNTNSIMFGSELNDSGMMDPRSEGMQDDPLMYQNNKIADGNVLMSNKKKRGRPKKVKGDGDETLPKIPRRTAVQSYDNEFNDDGTQRKKRGRPKKSKQQSNISIKNPEPNFDNKEGMIALPHIDNINNRNGISENNMSMHQNSSLISHHEQNNFLTHHPQHMQRMHHDQSENGFMHQLTSHSQLQQQHQSVHIPQHLQHNHMHQHHQQNPQILSQIHQQPLHSLTPPINMRYNTPSRSTPNSNSNASVGQNFQNSPQHQTTPTFSDLSSEISAAISSDHMGDSPTPNLPSLGQTDFETPVSLNSDSTSNVCQDIVGVGTLSRENKHQNQHTPPTNFHLAQLQSHSLDNNNDANRSYSPYRTNNYTLDNEHQTQQIQQQRSVSNNFILNRSLVSSPLPSHQRPIEQMQQQKPQKQQQQQPPHNHQQQSLGNATDVASKSLSGLESLVDQIPSIGDHNITGGGGGTISPVTIINTGSTTPNSSCNVDTEKIATPATSSSLENSQFGNNSCLYSSGYPNGAIIPPPTSSAMLSSNAYPISSASSSFTSTPTGLLTNTYGSSVQAPIPSHFSVSSLTTPNYHPSTTAAAYHSNLMNPLVHHHHGPTLFSVPVSPLYHPHAYQHSGYPSAYQPPTLHMPSPNYPYGYPPTNTYTGTPGTPSYHPMFDRHLKPDLGYGGF